VHYEGTCTAGPRMPQQASSFLSLARNGLFEPDVSWAINAAGTTAHEDAHVVHARVMRLPLRDRELVIQTGAAGRPLEWRVDVPALRVVPVRKAGSGTPRLLYGRGHRPIGCMIDYEGVPDDEAARIREAAKQRYGHWWSLLRLLRVGFIGDIDLSRWKVMETGVHPQPWITAA
jgi:hypothetical protein